MILQAEYSTIFYVDFNSSNKDIHLFLRIFTASLKITSGCIAPTDSMVTKTYTLIVFNISEVKFTYK